MSLPVFYTDNTKTPAQITTAGFKISKPGYDAQRTAGSNFIFNSSWPSLPIAFELSRSNPITSGGSSLLTVPHNLKFPPFCMVWAYGPDPSGIGNVATRFIALADATNIYITALGISSPPYSATKLMIRAFQLDLSRDVDYNLAPGDTFNLPYDKDYGIKAVKPTKDINSLDMRDFTVHSRCQSPLILAVKTEKTMPAANLATANGNVVQYTSPLKYPVWVYGFIKIGTTLAGNYGVPVNTYAPAPYYSQGYPRTQTDGFQTWLGYNVTAPNQDNGATLVILRDPMFAATKTTVQY